jgi:hypothetical protein
MRAAVIEYNARQAHKFCQRRRQRAKLARRKAVPPPADPHHAQAADSNRERRSIASKTRAESGPERYPDVKAKHEG